MFGVASSASLAYVSVAVGTNVVTLTFGAATNSFGTDAGSFVLVGSEVEGITSAIASYGATGTGSWVSNVNVPTFS